MSTIVYSEKVKGFPSFYSFEPEIMIGTNNEFYSFKGGNLYLHNSDAVNKNQFYGVDNASEIDTVFNNSPLESKLFKTISIEGSDAWHTDVFSDIGREGEIDESWFSKKEASFFAFIRGINSTPADISDYPMRSLNGIGRSILVTGGSLIDFDLSTKISNIISVGDMLYFSLPPSYDTPLLAGEVLSVDSNPLTGVNNITVNPATTGAVPITIPDAYYLFIKNSVAESHGILGHYALVKMENHNTDRINLFAIKSEIMKSYP